MTYKPESDLNHHDPIDPNHRYACKDRPRPGEPWLPLEESNSCGHTWRTTDPSCSDCKWRQDP